MTRDELVGIVRRIMTAHGSEEQLDELLATLESNVPHPAVSDLIFYPPDGHDLTADEIVDQALQYRVTDLGASEHT
ncbi:MAG: bacteriocin immunity protein [Polyangiaceae bacterium]